MAGIFSSFNTATKGLMASQTALHTTGHNISNVNTEGFTRQRVDMKADRAYSYTGVGQLGTGVKMEAVVRMIDDHVSKQVRTENSTLNRFGEKSDVINQLEVIFNEPSDTGLNFNIGEMFDAFQNLSENPGDINYKTVAVEKMKTLTDSLNHMGRQIKGLEGETHDAIEKNVLDFNATVEQLSSLNKQIFNISIKGQIPNDLLDQRDLMLKDLSAIGEVKVELDEYGRADIELGGKEILSKEGKQQYIKYHEDTKTINFADEDGNFVDKDGNIVDEDNLVEVNVENGKILGNIDALDDVKLAENKLNDLAKTIGKAINEVHGSLKVRNEKDAPENGELNGSHFDVAGPIFKFDTSDDNPEGALTIGINEKLLEDNSLLRGGEKPVGHKDYSQEDNSKALELAGLRSKKLDADGQETSEGNTISGSYRDIVIKIGVSKQHSDNMVDNQIALTNQLEMRRESVSGVSINDEITDVIKFQKSYEANAKVISALTEMLDVLINRTGV